MLNALGEEKKGAEGEYIETQIPFELHVDLNLMSMSVHDSAEHSWIAGSLLTEISYEIDDFELIIVFWTDYMNIDDDQWHKKCSNC